MPISLPGNFGDVNYEHKEGGSFVPIRGIYDATIFKIEQDSNDNGHFYSIDFRIDGGEFDGEDIKRVFVGLYSKAIFTLHDILKALGILDDYYDHEAKQWKALPSVEELQGGKLRIQVDNSPWQATDRDTKVGLVNPDGSPVLREGNAITAYFSANEPAPEYRPRPRKPRLAKVQPSNAGGAVPSVAGGFPGQVSADAASPWGGAGGNTAANPGGTGW